MKSVGNKFLVLLIFYLAFTACSKDNNIEVPVELDKGPDGSYIPYVSIDIGNGIIVDEPKINANMFIFQNQQSLFSSGIGIEQRGSTSRRLFPKKSYSIELWDENGADYSADIFGMGTEEDWILYGPYSDKTLIRNLLIYDLSNSIGQWAPECRLVEVSINHVYQGIYVFMEKIKQDGDRLQLEKLQPTMTASSVISGGYILKIDKTSGDTDNPDWQGDSDYSENLGFRSNYNPNSVIIQYPPYGEKIGEETYFLYEEPSADEINEQQKNYIQNYIRDFEDALANLNLGQNPRAYEQYIDVDSFVDFFILNEISSNPDAYRLSTFMHKDRDEKLKMGPIWDFNIAFGNDARSATGRWIYEYNERNPDDLWLVHFWWKRLLSDPMFKAKVKTRWNSLKTNELSESEIFSKIDNWVNHLKEDKGLDRNFKKWPVIGETLPFNSFVGNSYDEEVSYVKNWISERITWMDTQIANW